MPDHPRYQLLDKVASGSFATVYRGRDLELGREVAIKQIHEQFLADPQQLDRYWGEAQYTEAPRRLSTWLRVRVQRRCTSAAWSRLTPVAAYETTMSTASARIFATRVLGSSTKRT